MTETSPAPETPSELKSLLSAHGLAPNKRYGQNFLVEPRILDFIMRQAEIAETDIVLEVGTGAGTLTGRLALDAGFVITVEIDAGLHSLARDVLGNSENVRFVHGDIMASKTRLNDEVCTKLDQALVDPALNDFKVVANLPYNISTPFLSSLFVRYGAPDLMILMVQKELAENLGAEPGTKDYGPLGILTRLLAEVDVLKVLSREVFYPKPKVESAIVRIRGKGIDPPPVLRAFPLVRFLFSERRKALKGLLRKLPAVIGGPLSEALVDQVLTRTGLTGQERAEALEPELFLKLERALAEVLEED
ncbi:MAG: ribosomal RNA small subunit methyltransferase A [Planctomycetes bacterium]|nr:ribosomal RNA small subunit methyltransferase A [Planctomycetota bacterium]